jgi:hypothetical protein
MRLRERRVQGSVICDAAGCNRAIESSRKYYTERRSGFLFPMAGMQFAI